MRTSATARASARSSTTTSSTARARLLAADWPLAVVCAAAASAIALDNGGYFATEWGWAALALLWIAAVTLFLRERFAIGRLEVATFVSLTAFVGWVALSSTWSTSVEPSVLDVQRDLVYLAGLLVVFLVARGRSVAELLTAVCAAAALTSIYALAHLFFSPPDTSFSRLSEPLGYPNAVAIVGAFGALLAAGFAAHLRSRPARALCAASLVVFVLTIFFTFSRGTWIAVAAGLVTMLSLDSRRLALLRVLAAVAPVAGLAVWLGSRAHALTSPGGSWSSDAAHQGHLLALATVLLAAAAALAVTFGAPRIPIGRRASTAAATAAVLILLGLPGAAIAHYASRPATRSAHTPRAFSGRGPLWRQAWHEWEQHRVLGSGAGTFQEFWLQHRGTSANARNAHSLYL
jgi:O-antigen ligase